MKKTGWLIGAIAAAVLAGSSFGAVKAHAEELSLVGVSDELVRFYVSTQNELEVIDESFFGENIEEIETLTVGTETALLSQFTYVNIENSFANVRSGPSKDYAIVGRIYGGAVATAVGASNGWTKIISGNVEGYVLSDFLVFGQEAVDKAEARNKTKCRVLSTTLNLRSSASADSSLLHQIPANAELTILDRGNGTWYKVKYSTGYQSWTGYVYAEYVSRGYYYAITAARLKELEKKTYLDNILWPFPGVYDIYSDYGMRLHPISGVYKMHTGLDIGGISGAAEVAALDGTVSSVGFDPYGGGNYVVVTTYTGGIKVDCKYLHCQNIYVKVGQSVVQGQKVASCGRTGTATGPHLHFTLAINGSNVDPMDYFYKYEYALIWHCKRN